MIIQRFPLARAQIQKAKPPAGTPEIFQPSFPDGTVAVVFLAAAVQDCRRIAGYCDFVRLDLFVFPDDLRISGDRVKTQIGIRTAAVAVNFTVRIAERTEGI